MTRAELAVAVSTKKWCRWIPDGPYTTKETFEVISHGTLTAVIRYKDTIDGDCGTRPVYIQHLLEDAELVDNRS